MTDWRGIRIDEVRWGASDPEGFGVRGRILNGLLRVFGEDGTLGDIADRARKQGGQLRIPYFGPVCMRVLKSDLLTAQGVPDEMTKPDFDFHKAEVLIQKIEADLFQLRCLFDHRNRTRGG